MSCEDIGLLTPDYLTGDLGKEDLARMEAHLAQCETCRGEIQGLSETWARLGVLEDEEPGPALREGFYRMLEEELDEARKAPSSFPGTRRNWGPVWGALAATVLLALGVGLGSVFGSRAKTGRDPEVARMASEIDSLEEQVSVALLGEASAGERLKGVALAGQLKQPHADLPARLLEIVDNDPNVNVRLSAVDALYLFSGQGEVRQGLTRSLNLQKVPVVQIALIDLLVAVRERRAAEALQALVKDQRIRPEVRQRAESAMKQLL